MTTVRCRCLKTKWELEHCNQPRIICLHLIHEKSLTLTLWNGASNMNYNVNQYIIRILCHGPLELHRNRIYDKFESLLLNTKPSHAIFSTENKFLSPLNTSVKIISLKHIN
jgi:hypothetical protein